MKWIKQGKIFEPEHNFGWMNSHAQAPTVLVLEDRLRVYFSTRPRNDLGLTTFMDLDADDPKKILYIHDKPILELGKPGTFDSHGLFPSHVRVVGGRVYLYYLGWYRGSSVPYHNAVGLAVSDDGGLSFRKLFDGPILERSAREPYSMMSLYVVEREGVYHMLYTAVYDWVNVGGRYEPAYNIRLATSRDGVEWTKADRVCVAENYYGECVARPSITERRGVYHMWLSYRGSEDFRDGRDSYRIGYARSKDLIEWTRQDELAGIEPSATGWDSTMITYPCVVEVGGRHLMFYNGNGFGASGYGYATASWGDDADEGR
jgi:predicted GH43/DUF377 family glycosyl hydrolase